MIGCYARVSTAEQAESGHSIDEQIDRMNKYCDALGWKARKNYIDAGFTGANTNRPALKNLIEDILNGKVDKVLVYKLDRLSRSQKDTLRLIEDVFLSNGTDFVSISENFDTSTPLGRAMIGILAVFAQLEREQIKERMSMGKEGRAKEGKFRGGGFVPIGYDYIDGELKINEYEAMQIREIHELFQSGMPVKAIARLFIEKGYTHKYGIWQEIRIKRLLMSDLYTGNIHYHGKSLKGNHEPIIDDETFNKSLALCNSLDYSKNKNKGRISYLGGLLYCSKCGAKYSAFTSRYKDTIYRYYMCHSKRKSNLKMIKDPNCQNKTWNMDELDQLVFDEIGKLAFDHSYVHKAKKKDNSGKIKVLQKEKSKIEKQKSRFLDLYGLGTFTPEEIQAKTIPLNEQIEKIDKEIKSLMSESVSEDDTIQILNKWDDVLKHGDFEQIRSLINALISKIEIDGEDITIFWKFT
jgi:site-specific DNA recombinase